MEFRQFGNTDMKVSVLGFGGAEIGYEGASQETTTELLQAALDAGLNVVDTAECYKNSEELIGNAISGRREEFYLFTKCGHYEGGVADWSPESLLRSIERSLKRLQVEQVDLVQLHSCSEEELRKGDVITALQTAWDRGYTRYIGYSGDSQAAKYAVECGAFDALQTSLSIADQEALDLTLPLALEKNLGVIIKRPIANAAWRTGSKPENGYHHAYWDRLQELQYDFLQDNLNASIATALRFTLFQPGVHTAIVGTTKPGRWSSNAGLVRQGPLPDAQVQTIRERWEEVSQGKWVGET